MDKVIDLRQISFQEALESLEAPGIKRFRVGAILGVLMARPYPSDLAEAISLLHATIDLTDPEETSLRRWWAKQS